MADEKKSGKKDLLIKAAFVVGLGMSLFHLYFSTIGLLTTISVRGGHLIFAMVIIFLVYPLYKKREYKIKILDIFLAVLAVVSGMYIIILYPQMVYHLGELTFWDKLFGFITIVLTLEVTRRTIGFSLTLIAIIFLIYAVYGPYFPGALGHRGYDFERIVSQMYCCLEGIYGIPLGVMAIYVYLFILFGAFLQKSGATDFFIKMAYALTGHYAGGPAKTAVIASGFMGSVSGSAIANTVTTGSVTIPLMKKVGYRPETAGGIEAAASTGGQLMPPLMGAGAFIMSEYTGIPYITIVKVSVIPAMMYYFTVGLFVHNEAMKLGLKGLSRSELPRIKEVLPKGFHCLIPIALLIVLLVGGYSPTLAASASIGAVLVTSMFRKDTRMSPRDIIEALVMASRSAVPISAACASAGIIVGVVGLTGLGLKFSAMVLSVSGNNIFIALILILLASLVLGMGLPVTASYIMLAVLGAPALNEMGVPLLAAHLIIFWYSQDANVTPPVCLAGYAGAGIAGANPMSTGMAAWKLSKGLYLIPILFAYRPEILFDSGFWPAVLMTLFGTIGLVAGVAALDGYLVIPLSIFWRVLMVGVTIGIFWPSRTLSILGSCVFAVFLLFLIYKKKSENASLPVSKSAETGG